ncbi:MAG TPA: GNAT family N-acetyltransferase, partial [Burkholderiaceae bacterium]
MNELLPHIAPAGTKRQPAAVPPQRTQAGILVSWARHLDEVRQAQRLRYTVFVTEMGARLGAQLPGHDM